MKKCSCQYATSTESRSVSPLENLPIYYLCESLTSLLYFAALLYALHSTQCACSRATILARSPYSLEMIDLKVLQ